ncbi:MAG TPA: heme o synthase [Terriglobales bacterium]|nr:heme o synthase [Terriglobales bacterium]
MPRRLAMTMDPVAHPAPAAQALVLGSHARRSKSWRLKSLRTLADYWGLTKPEINFMIAITTAGGFWMAADPERFSWLTLLHTVASTVFVASGAAALNQVMEKPYDSQMRRTQGRPLVVGRIKASSASYFGWLISLLGLVYLAISTSRMASLLAAISLLGYLFLYTPLKRKTRLATFIGAIFGALPPLIGWAAVRGSLEPNAWVLFAIVFLWQIPHFAAIAWMYREDYARAGYRVMPSDAFGGALVRWEAMVGAAVLVPLGIAPTLGSGLGPVVSASAFLISALFLCAAGRFAFFPSRFTARRLLVASIIYLPLMFGVIAAAKR